MSTLVIIMLCLQVAIVIVTAYAIGFRKPTPAKPRPIWFSFGISLIVIAGVSWQIGGDHARNPGAVLLGLGSAFLLGMAVVVLLLDLRERRGA
jgi:hypothetical protein